MLKSGFQKEEQHRRKDFPFTVHPCIVTAQLPLGEHYHDHMEILYFQKNSGFVRIGDSVLKAREGDIFLVNPFQVHSVRYHGKGNAGLYALVFHSLLLEHWEPHRAGQGFIGEILKGDLSLPPFLEQSSPLYEAVKDSVEYILGEEFRRKKGYELFITTELERLFMAFSRYGQPDTRPVQSGTAPFLFDLYRYITEHFKEQISLEEAAALVHMHPSYLCRQIKKYTGFTFTQYLNMYRIRKAEDLLIHTYSAVADIAEDCGFRNLSYFNRKFLDVTGMTPREYRLRGRKEGGLPFFTRL